MDKAKVIAAYANGFITLKECEQILGIEASFILGMMHEFRRGERTEQVWKQPANR